MKIKKMNKASMEYKLVDVNEAIENNEAINILRGAIYYKQKINVLDKKHKIELTQEIKKLAKGIKNNQNDLFEFLIKCHDVLDVAAEQIANRRRKTKGLD
jgi:phage antirepressor YoqD-like protein